jgi:hypothetical protein
VDSAGHEASPTIYASFQTYAGDLTADGRYAAFVSFAPNLVPGDTNGSFDVFVRDLSAGTTERVSLTSSGGQGSGGGIPRMSADGRYVVFESGDALVPGDTNGWSDVYVRDRVAGTTERMSLGPAGEQGNYFSDEEDISADGRYVAFRSGAWNFPVGDYAIYVRDRVTGVLETASAASGGKCGPPSISGDGRYVSYPLGDDCQFAHQLVRFDRVTHTAETVSVDPLGAPGNAPTTSSDMGEDGSVVAFASPASNLVAGDTNQAPDVFVRVFTTADVTPPVIHLPNDMTVEATSAGGATVGYAVTATDDIDPNPTVVCAPPSGRTFPLGSTTVSCTATDASGNSATGSFTITVVDTTPPTLTLPANKVVDATGPGGAAVSYTATATDTVDPSPAVTCVPPSGTMFPVGTITVSCTAADSSGNSAHGSFTIKVKGAGEQLADLAAAVKGVGPGKSLADTVEVAQWFLAHGQTQLTCLTLTAFQLEMRAQSGKKIPAAQATALIADANRIKAVLGNTR